MTLMMALIPTSSVSVLVLSSALQVLYPPLHRLQ